MLNQWWFSSPNSRIISSAGDREIGCKDFVPPKTFGVEATATSIAEASIAAPESAQS